MQSKTLNVETFVEFLSQIKDFGNCKALTDASDDTSLSFLQLHTSVYDLLDRLPVDIPKGSRVVLYDLKPLDWVVTFFAVALRGWIVVPLDTRVSTDFILSVEELTTPALIIIGNATTLQSSCRILKISELQSAVLLQRRELDTVDSDAPVEILFTSGTWARPKGVVLSQRNVLSNAYQVLSVYQQRQEDVSLAVLPLSHAYQQTVGLILPLLRGSHIVFLTKISSEALSNALNKYEVKTMLVVPRVLSLLENALLRKIKSLVLRRFFARIIRISRHLPRFVRRILFSFVHRKIGKDLSTFIVGGAPLSFELDTFFQGLGYKVIVGYGASECSPTIAVSFNQKRVAGEIGQALPGVETYLNEKGELNVKGLNVFLGYWPNMTRPDVFNTEDVAILDSRKSYVLKGRTKNLVIYPNGDKIFCEDVEYIINQIQGVEDCCVVTIPTQTGVVLCCALKSDDTLQLNESSIKELVNKQLPFGIHLDHVLFVHKDDFPYTHTLKVNRQQIQSLCIKSASASLPN